MTEFDLDALEKALSSKSRQPRQSLSLGPAKSKQELFDEAKKLASELYSVYHKTLRTRYRGDSYCVRYWEGSLRRNDIKLNDISNVPIQVFENLVSNGRRYLKDYHNMVNTLVTQSPELALEANLEGKTGTEVLQYVYSKRLDELDKIIRSRILSPEAELYIHCDMWFESSTPQFKLTISGWLHRSGSVSVSGVELHPKKPEDMAKLFCFLNHFDDVVKELKRQIDAIKINKG
jgi:hypothetical protein